MEARVTVTEARETIGPISTAVNLQDRIIRLTRHGRDESAVVPADVGDLIDQVGGLAAARTILFEAKRPRSSP